MSFWSTRSLFLPLNKINRPVYIVAPLMYIAATGQAQEAADFFRQNCVSCHTVGGGRLTGPDLKNITQRKEGAQTPDSTPAKSVHNSKVAGRLLASGRMLC